MMRLSLLLLLSIPAGAANAFVATFSATQNPLGPINNVAWLNGAADGKSWSNCATDGAMAHGSVINANAQFNDSTCVLSGAWSQNQTAQATMHLANTSDSATDQEVALHLNTSISSGNITGYEFNASVHAATASLLIVRWNGPLNSFCFISKGSTCDHSAPIQVALHDGDVLKAINAGGTLSFYVNGTLKASAKDTTYTTGAPGMGFRMVGGTAAELAHFGFSNFAAVDSGAPIVNAASCSIADIAKALAALSTDYTLINVPAGTCSSNTGTIFTTSHSFELAGQGQVATLNAQGNPATYTDATKIVDTQPGTGGNNPILTIVLKGPPSQIVRITGLTFQGGNVVYNGEIALGGTKGNFRLDHNHFFNNGSLEIADYQPATGIADHNLFDVPPGNVYNNIRVFNTEGEGHGDEAWTRSPGFGTGLPFYFENNTYNDGFMNDCALGGTYVARFNTFNVTRANANIGIQSHAVGSQQRARGCRAWEVYQNVIGNGGGSITYSAEFQTSGTGIIWGNTVTHSVHDIAFNSPREDTGTYRQADPPNGWGYCGAHQTGKPSPWDGNTDASGYPCLDNIGRGQGDKIGGNWPGVQNSAAHGNGGGWPHQIAQPVYIAGGESCECSSAPILATTAQRTIAANRDYFAPVNHFDGTSGTGTGTIAARPATCTPGVGYWATDQGNWNLSGSGPQGLLYTCTAPNTWTLYYTPYTYPHPLVADPSLAASQSHAHGTPAQP